MSLEADGGKVFRDIQEALEELANGVKDANESARDSHRQHGQTQRNIASLERVMNDQFKAIHDKLDRILKER